MLQEAVNLNDEEGRVRALDRLNILDTEPESPFETIVTLVQQTLRVPMCGVSLIDRRRHWFKARRGVAAQEFERRLSFCNRTIERPDALIIPDALADPEFKEHPFVLNDPFIRFYAGIPLKTADGYNIGSLCVLSPDPRRLEDHELAILRNFARVVMDELELRQMATTDLLTGAMSRRACLENARLALRDAKAKGGDLSVALFDIDRFKSVNDSHGHGTGDKVIKALADCMTEGMREADIFGRLGGEEFALFMPDVAVAEGRLLADDLRVRFSTIGTALPDGGTLTCSASGGVAGFRGDPGTTVENLLERGDEALYRAKSGGRNRVEIA